MHPRPIDLNCDLAEEPAAWGRDLELLAHVTSANIACGGHAGDAGSMRRAVLAAAERAVAVGAHPSYPDRAHFGRRELEMEPSALADAVAQQVGTLRSIARQLGVDLRHVKPHGALYHRAARDPIVARAVAVGVARVDPGLCLFGPAGSRALQSWRDAGLSAVAEAFVDRSYEPDGTLRSRALDGALLDAQAAAAQAVSIARDGWAPTAGGGRVRVGAVTYCLHADTPGALAIARAVRDALTDAGFALASSS